MAEPRSPVPATWHNPHSVSWTVHVRTPLDFAVWILTLDGMRVEGFDKHPDGSGELRDLGMTPNLWHDWVCNAMQSHQTGRAARRGVADSIRSTSAGGLTRSHRSPDEARAFLRPGPSPVLAWAGSSQVAARLDALWREFDMTRSSPSDLPEDLEVVLDKPISRETNEGPNAVHVYLTDYVDLAVFVCRPASALVSLGAHVPIDRLFASAETFTDMTDMVELKLRE
jgi:hypothetical protein